MIKIFQFADLHLDSPFASLDVRKAGIARQRLRELFCRMIKYARDGEYDLVLIPGDLYEDGYLTEETMKIVTSELATLACPVFISPGNHDPYLAGSLYKCAKFSENVHVFNESTLTRVDLPNIGASVYGYAFTSPSLPENLIANRRVSDAGVVNILCAHTDVFSPAAGYAPTTYADIEAAGFTYAALGHIHKAPEIYRGSCTAAYSGFSEGRGFDETGAGHALSVKIFDTGELKTVEAERISFSTHIYEIRTLDIAGAEDDAAVMGKIRSLISAAEYGSAVSLRVVLTGLVSPSYRPNTAFLERACRAELDTLEVRDETLPLLGGELDTDMTLRGEVYRYLKDKMTSGTEEERENAALALRIALAALEERDIALFMPPEEASVTGDAPNKDERERGERSETQNADN